MHARNVLARFLMAAFAGAAAPAEGIDPPWNRPPEDGLNFTVPGVDNVPDLQGDVNDPQLTVFFAGNQYMVVRDLVKAFRAAHPQYQRVFVETLPPGILAAQIRQTPMRVMQGKCDVGVVWYTEAFFHATMKQHPINMVALPDEENRYATYTAGLMKEAPHPRAGEDFLLFLQSQTGQAIYRKYGFLAPE